MLNYLNDENDNQYNNNQYDDDDENNNDNNENNENNENNDNNDNYKNSKLFYHNKNMIDDISKTDIFSDIYISTKTKIGYLDHEINIYDVFWKISLLNYHDLKEGFIKKQIKLSFYNDNEVNEFKNKLKNYNYYNSKQLVDINNPNGRIKFKNIKIVTIGVCKKDLLKQ